MRTRAVMYHDVVDGNPDVYAVTPALFREHLDAIAAAAPGPPETVETLVDGRAGSGAWMLTFDDGGAGWELAGEELARRSWRGHFFVVTEWIGRPGFLTWDGVRTLAQQGHVVGSHTCTHPDRMADLSRDELLREWTRSKAELGDELGRPVTTASVPGGLYSREVGRTAAAAGYASLFTSLPSTRVRSIDGCALVGRYAIRRETTAAQAAEAASGRAGAWARQRAGWALREPAKKIGGKHYERARRAILARR